MCLRIYTGAMKSHYFLIDYKKKNQGAWFGYVKRKVENYRSEYVATMAFNEAFSLLNKFTKFDKSSSAVSKSLLRIRISLPDALNFTKMTLICEKVSTFWKIVFCIGDKPKLTRCMQIFRRSINSTLYAALNSNCKE